MKLQSETYGVAVRAGVITPQLADEEAFRLAAGLPVIGDEAKRAWEENKGFRRPITLRDPNDTNGSLPGNGTDDADAEV